MKSSKTQLCFGFIRVLSLLLLLNVSAAYQMTETNTQELYFSQSCYTYGAVATNDNYFYVAAYCDYPSSSEGRVIKFRSSEVMWSSYISLPSQNSFLGVDVDSDGGCIVTEYGDTTTFVHKFDSSGNSIWTWQNDLLIYSQYPFRVKVLPNDGYVIVGTIDFYIPFITKISYSNPPSFVWRNQLTNGYRGFNGVEKGSDGSLIAVMEHPYWYFPLSYAPCQYAKFSADGDLLDIRLLKVNAKCENVKKLSDGDFLFTGLINNYGNYNSWIYKISINEIYQWEVAFDIAGDDYVLATNQMANKDIVLAVHSSTMNFWTVILDSEGNLINQISSHVSSYDFYAGAVASDGSMISITSGSNAPLAYITTLCPIGTYSSPNHNGKCYGCEVGTYQPSIREICYPCPDGTYQNQSGQGSCKSCFTHCKSCTNATDCSACVSTHLLYTPPSDPAQCVTSCFGPYFASPPICKRCPINCLNCTDDYYCFECDQNYFLDKSKSTTHKCVARCPSGYFANLLTRTCESCFENCISCANPTWCLECLFPLAIKYSDLPEENRCVSDCGPRFFINTGKSPRVCEKCDFRCLVCSGPANDQCTTCDSSKLGVVRETTTKCICTIGYVPDTVNEVCKKCKDPLCNVCNPSDVSECFECTSLVENIIYDQIAKKCVCKSGYYRTEDVCKTCNIFCIECTGPSNKDCLPDKCKNGAYPIASLRTSCMYMCESPQNDLYSDNIEKLCKYCVSPCRSCFAGTPTSCTSCTNELYLYENACNKSCPYKFYSENYICFPCDPRCKNCINKVNYCIEGCEQPYLYKDHRCLTECGDGYAPINGICERCDDDCSICIYKTHQMICLKCLVGKHLHDGKCLNVCPSGFYPEVRIGKCTECNEACSQCFGDTSRDCYSCNYTLGYMMIAEGICGFPSCTDGSYFDVSLKSCALCPKECSKCFGVHNCTECIKGYNFDYIKKKCYDPCNKLGFTRKANSLECEEICGDGRNMGVLQCDDGNKKDNDGCSSKCRVETYYECSGGNPDTPDICIYKKLADVISFKYSADQSAILIFDTRLKLLDSLENLITFSLDKAENPLVEWSYEAFNTKSFKMIKFRFKFFCSLTGIEDLILNFKKPEKFEDMVGNTLGRESVKTKLMKYRYISEGEKKGAEGAGTASLYAMLPSMALSLGLSLVLYL